MHTMHNGTVGRVGRGENDPFLASSKVLVKSHLTIETQTDIRIHTLYLLARD
jgi:hypothetical protein